MSTNLNNSSQRSHLYSSSTSNKKRLSSDNEKSTKGNELEYTMEETKEKEDGDLNNSPPSHSSSMINDIKKDKQPLTTKINPSITTNTTTTMATSSTTTNILNSKNPNPNSSLSNIQEVWVDNFTNELSKLENIVETYPYIAVDTEFPGVVCRPLNSFSNFIAYSYSLFAENVNMLKMIQLGMTFYNEKGETPHPISTWQFNFKFSLSEDMYAPDSIQLLLRSGVDFTVLAKKGIDHIYFAECMMMSGLILNDDIKWICFHGGYDFAYLLKTLTNRDLPAKEEQFFWMLERFFPNVYDLKVLLSIHGITGSLQKLADSLRVKRKGHYHQAGSDSLLTGDLFFRIRQEYAEDIANDEKRCLNTLYGIGCGSHQSLANHRNDVNYALNSFM